QPLSLRHRVRVVLIRVFRLVADGRLPKARDGVHGSRFVQRSSASLTSGTDGQQKTADEEEEETVHTPTTEGRTHRACLPCGSLPAGKLSCRIQALTRATGSHASSSPRYPPGPAYILTFPPRKGVPSV